MTLPYKFIFSVGGVSNRFTPYKVSEFANEWKTWENFKASNLKIQYINGVTYLAGTIETNENYNDTKARLQRYFNTYFTSPKLSLNTVSLNPIINPINVPVSKPKTASRILNTQEVRQVIQTVSGSDNKQTIDGVKDDKNWFDKTFFDGAGALTATGIGIIGLVVIVILKK